jgi:hypothetical protein
MSCSAAARRTTTTAARSTFAMQHALATALDVVEVSYRFAGTAALHRDSVIKRCFRDVQTARMHIAFGLEGFRSPGRDELGRG